MKREQKAATKKAAARSRAELRFRAFVRRFDESMGMHYLEVPRSAFEKLGGKLMVRLVARVNEGKEFHCALMPAKKGQVCILFSKAKMKDAGLREGQSARITARIDTSKYGMKVPPELTQALKQDPEGRKRFEKLSKGKQRNIIYYVASTKNPEQRIDRAVQLIQDLQTLPPGQESLHELVKLEKARKKAARGEPAPELEAIRSRADEEDFLSKFLPAERRTRPSSS